MFVLLWGGEVQAEGLTSKEFLEFSAAEQHWWFAGAVESIAHMVYLHDEERAQCVWLWLPTDMKAKKALVIENFEKYPDYAPTSILLALLKRDCGPLLPE